MVSDIQKEGEPWNTPTYRNIARTVAQRHRNIGHRRLQGRKPIQTIHAALDQEINLVNTAPAYGFGTDRAKIHGSADKRKSQETGEENSPVFL
ncbi:hypothetical protein UF14_04995 [Bacillus licheniformis]|nr:hypothetical protein UF14_04995 [Bacillus licheniformis]